MEHSHSETSSDGVAVTDVIEPTYSNEYVQELQDSLNWHAAIMTVLLAEAGGVVEISGKELNSIQLDRAKAQVSYDEERDVYIIEGLYKEDES